MSGAPGMPDSPPTDFFRANDLMRTVERYMTPEESSRVYDAFLLAAQAQFPKNG